MKNNKLCHNNLHYLYFFLLLDRLGRFISIRVMGGFQITGNRKKAAKKDFLRLTALHCFAKLRSMIDIPVSEIKGNQVVTGNAC